MGLNPEVKCVEIVLRQNYWIKPGLSPYKAFSKFINFDNIISKDISKIKIGRTYFQGINYGYLQLTPPVRAKKKIIKKRK